MAAKKPQDCNNFVIFDFETGGLDSTKNAITEIALISIDGDTLKVINKYQSLIAPSYDSKLTYEQKALDVSNITFEQLMDEGKDIKQVANEVYQCFIEANTRQNKLNALKPILVGHNVKFDINFLNQLFYYGFGRGYQKQLEQSLKGSYDYYGNYQCDYLDTLLLSKSWLQSFKDMPSYKLSNVVERLGVDINNAHRAMNDVVSTVDVFRVYLNAIRQSDGQQIINSREGFYFPI